MTAEPRALEVVEPTETRSLHRKLAQIMYEAERIPKNGTAPQAMGGFKFVQVGDAADFIRKALAEKVISMLPTHVQVVGQTEHATKTGGSMTTVDLVTTWTLTDGESGESIEIQSFGAGADGGDKYSGKAQTNAMKYALLMGFLLSTGDDPELSDSTDRQARKPANAPAPQNETADGSLIGNVIVGKPPCDLELRQTPEGPIAGFKLTQGRGGLQVLASGNLANALHPFLASLVGQRVQVWGSVDLVPWQKDGKDMPPYKRLSLSKIKTDEWTLPGDVPTPHPGADDEREPVTEGQYIGADEEPPFPESAAATPPSSPAPDDGTEPKVGDPCRIHPDKRLSGDPSKGAADLYHTMGPGNGYCRPYRAA